MYNVCTYVLMHIDNELQLATKDTKKNIVMRDTKCNTAPVADDKKFAKPMCDVYLYRIFDGIDVRGIMQRAQRSAPS